MTKCSLLLKKTDLIVLAVALALAILPIANAYAAGLSNPTAPPDTTQLPNRRLEHSWARWQQVYERQGRILDRADGMVEQVQHLIDRAEGNGKDVSALQAALDTFKIGLKEAHPVYESAKGIISSHQGFNVDGLVTDREKAIETVKELRDKLQGARGIMEEPGKVLREAIKVYREANHPTDLFSS